MLDAGGKQLGGCLHAFGQHQRGRLGVTDFLQDMLAPGGAQALEVGHLGDADHLDPMRVNQVEVTDLIDWVGRPDARCAMPLRSTADPVQPDHIGGMLDQLQDAQIRDTGRIGFVRSMRG